jgi:hypothetical protein
VNILAGIAEIKADLEGWRAAFSWPVSDQEWFGLSEMAFDRFEAVYQAVDGQAADLLLADFGFLYHLLSQAHLLLAGQRAGAEAPGLDWDGLAREFSRPIQAGAALRLRSLAKNLVYNSRTGAVAVASWLLGSRRVLGLGSMTAIKSGFLARRGGAVDHRYLEEVLAGRQGAGETPAKESARALAQSVAELVESAWGVRLDADAAARAWGARLGDLAGCARALNARGRFPAELYVSDVAHPLVKLVCLCAARAGSRVAGFSHGNDIGMLSYRVYSYIEPSHFQDFYLPTANAAANVADKYALSGMPTSNPVRFLSADSRNYARLVEQCAKAPLPGAGNRVMLMGYPMNEYRYLDDVGAYSRIRLEMELRLVDDLRAQGFSVIYKGHPDRRAEVLGIFDGRVDHIEFSPFEQVWSSADALLFTYPGTTTFGYALCTNRPIVLLDHVRQQWNPRVRQDLARRCAMVPASFDERNRIVYSLGELAEALRRPPAEPDYTVVERYMIPEQARA